MRTNSSTRNRPERPTLSCHMCGYRVSFDQQNHVNLSHEVFHTSSEGGRVDVSRVRKSLSDESSVNLGIFQYLKVLQANELIDVDKRGGHRLRGPLRDFCNEESPLAASMDRFLRNWPSGLIVRHKNVLTEQVALTICKSYPSNSILFLTQNNFLGRMTQRYLLQNSIDSYFHTNANSRIADEVPGLKPVAISTVNNSANIYPGYEILVPLDMNVISLQNFHGMFYRPEDPVPILLGVVSASSSWYQERFIELCKIFGLAHFHYYPNDKIQKHITSIRLPFVHGSTGCCNALQTRIRQVVKNHDRNRMITKCAKALKDGNVPRGSAPRQIRRFQLATSIRHVVVVVDELLHAALLLKELPDWKFISRLSENAISSSSLDKRHRQLVSAAVAQAQPAGYVVLSDSLKFLRDSRIDAIIYAGASSSPPKIPPIMKAGNLDERLLVIDVADYNSQNLEQTARSRKRAMQQEMIYRPDVGPLDGTWRKFHDMLSQGSRRR